MVKKLFNINYLNGFFSVEKKFSAFLKKCYDVDYFVSR